jgi:hypothetical protein
MERQGECYERRGAGLWLPEQHHKDPDGGDARQHEERRKNSGCKHFNRQSRMATWRVGRGFPSPFTFRVLFSDRLLVPDHTMPPEAVWTVRGVS